MTNIKYKKFLKALRFYFITDYDSTNNLSVQDQVKVAIESGVTVIQYRNKNFNLEYYDDVIMVRNLCHDNEVMFIVNDNVLLAKSVNADGVHLGQGDESIILARRVMGPNAILGLSISTLDELNKSDVTECDYIGVGPVFPTKTKIDAKPSRGIDVLRKIVQNSPVPVVAIGGINSVNARACIECGTSGIAVISCISRSKNIATSAVELAHICLDNSKA